MNYRFPKRDTAVGWQVSAAAPAYYLLRTQVALSGIRIEMKKRKGELLYYMWNKFWRESLGWKCI
jgi:hypothetical protein